MTNENASAERIEAFQQMFRDLLERSRQLRQEILTDNEKLRQRVQELETDLATVETVLSSEFANTSLETERLVRRTSELQTENRDFAERTVELEDRASSLANLYAAAFQLHSTLDPGEVIQTISEIAINLIGGADFVLYLSDESRGDFVLACREGDLAPKETRVPGLSRPVERRALSEHRTVFQEELPEGERAVGDPLCCVPLIFRERLVGVLSLYGLLSHKKAFSSLDRELLDLLGEQAALAIVSSQSFVAVDRKLKTVQSFMDVLKS